MRRIYETFGTVLPLSSYYPIIPTQPDQILLVFCSVVIKEYKASPFEWISTSNINIGIFHSFLNRTTTGMKLKLNWVELVGQQQQQQESKINIELSQLNYRQFYPAMKLNSIKNSPAKLRIPRQFEGWSCRRRNLQQASRTDWIWSRLEAGRRTWTLSSVIVISPA